MTHNDQIIADASRAYRGFRAWRATGRGKCAAPRPTGSEVVLTALGIPLNGRGTNEQEHMWAILVDKAIDFEDDRGVHQPPRMLRRGNERSD